MDICKLSNEELLHIFSFLEPLELLVVHEVCKRWRELCSQKSLWKNVEINFGGTCGWDDDEDDVDEDEDADDDEGADEDEKSVPLDDYQLLKVAPVVKKLTFSDLSVKESSQIVSKMFMGNPPPKEVKQLDFGSVQINEEDLFRILDYARAHVEKLGYGDVDVIYSGMQTKPLVQNFPSLKSIGTNLEKDPGAYKDMGIRCPKLQQVEICLDRRMPQSLGWARRFLSKMNKKLEHFSLSCLDMKPLTEVDDFFNKFPNLQTFSIDCESSTFNFHRDKDSKRMSVLEMNTFNSIPKNILSNFTALRRIEVMDLIFSAEAYNSLVPIISACPNLKKISCIQRCAPWEHNKDPSCLKLKSKGFALASTALKLMGKAEYVGIEGCETFMNGGGNMDSLKKSRPSVECEFTVRESDWMSKKLADK